MRRKSGDGVRVFNGYEGEWAARVEVMDRRHAALNVLHQTRMQTNTPDLAVYFSPVKKTRTDFIVEKATELGARDIVPVMMARTIAERVKTERLAALAREAAEQTERLDLPAIAEPIRLDRLITNAFDQRTLIFCDEAGDDADQAWGGSSGRAHSIAEVLQSTPEETRWGVLIGPEGGFTPEERDTLRDLPNVLAVSLGPRILRADTAVVSVLSVLQALKGDWR